MSDFITGFLGEGVEEPTQNETGQKIKVKVTKITREKNYEFAPGFTFEDAVVYYFMDEKKRTFTKGDSLLKRNGQPYTTQGMMRDLNWYQDRVTRPSVTFDVNEAVKSALGEKKYEALRKEHGGKFNHKMLLNVPFEVTVIEGSQKGKEYRFYQLPLENIYSNWKYMIDRGEVASWEEIEEVQQRFGLTPPQAADNSTLVEKALTGTDLPF